MQGTTPTCMEVNQEALDSSVHDFFACALHQGNHKLEQPGRVWAEKQAEVYFKVA